MLEFVSEPFLLGGGQMVYLDAGRFFLLNLLWEPHTHLDVSQAL